MGSIRAEGLGKFYKRYSSRWGRLTEWLDPDGIDRHQKHWVLREINFEVRAGESIGIIGHNGAGKSTLLKLITGTTQPSTGRAVVNGRVAALLELGMGFHPDFTGRQNAFMSGQLLGYSSEEVSARMSEIETFADIGDYLDQPVRTYSSGMQVRLAFSVATSVRPDILIVDEALSVGDIFFQQKCFERIKRFKEQGTTLLFVTHSLSTVYSLCDRVLLLDHGVLVRDADPKTVIDLYQAKELELINRQHLAAVAQAIEVAATVVPAQPSAPSNVAIAESSKVEADVRPPAPLASSSGNFATEMADIDRVVILSGGAPAAAIISDSDIVLVVTATAHAELDDPHVGFQIRDARGEPVFMTNTYCMKARVGHLGVGQRVTVRFSMKLPLAAGEYSVTAGIANGGYDQGSFRQSLARQHAAAALSVAADRTGIIWSGICNLHPSVDIVRSGVALTDSGP